MFTSKVQFVCGTNLSQNRQLRNPITKTKFVCGILFELDYLRNVHKVLSEQPSLSIRGSSFLRELLSDDIGESVAEAIKIILEGGDNL